MHCLICNKWGCHDIAHKNNLTGRCELCGHKIEDWRDHSMGCSQRTPSTVIRDWNLAIVNASNGAVQWGALMAEYQVVFNQAQDEVLLSYGAAGKQEVSRRMALEA